MDRPERRLQAVLVAHLCVLADQRGVGALGEVVDEGVAVLHVLGVLVVVGVASQRQRRLEDRLLARGEGLVLDVADQPALVRVGHLRRALDRGAPPITAFVSTYLSSALPASAPSALAGSEISAS